MTMFEEILQPFARQKGMGLSLVMKRKYWPYYSYLSTTFNLMLGNIMYCVV